MTLASKQTSASDYALLVLLGILLGAPYALTKISQLTIPPLTGVAARVVFAAAALWIVVFVSKIKLNALREYATLLLVQGIISCAVPYALIAYGQLSVNSALTAILNSTTPVFVCVISFFWTRHEQLNCERLFGLFVGLTGVIIIAGTNSLHGLGKETLGQAAIILATVCSALAAIQGRRLNTIPPVLAAAGTLSCGSIVLVPICFVIDLPFHAAPSAGSVAALAINALFGTALRSVIYFRLLRTIGSIGVSSAGYLKPAVGVLIGCTFLDEALTWTTLVGLLAVCAGVAAANPRHFLAIRRATSSTAAPAVPTG